MAVYYTHLDRAGVCPQLCLPWDFEAQEEGEKAGSLLFWLSSKDTRWLQVQRVKLTRVGAMGESERGIWAALVTMNTLSCAPMMLSSLSSLFTASSVPAPLLWGGVAWQCVPSLSSFQLHSAHGTGRLSCRAPSKGQGACNVTELQLPVASWRQTPQLSYGEG